MLSNPKKKSVMKTIHLKELNLVLDKLDKVIATAPEHISARNRHIFISSLEEINELVNRAESLHKWGQGLIAEDLLKEAFKQACDLEKMYMN